jgi:hypothetical protein
MSCRRSCRTRRSPFKGRERGCRGVASLNPGILGFRCKLAWLDQHPKDGTNVPMTSAQHDRLTVCAGFADAMRAVGWSEGREGALIFPKVRMTQRESATARASDRKRQHQQREADVKRDKCPKNGGTEIRTNDRDFPDQRREEKRINRLTPPGEPPSLDEVRPWAGPSSHQGGWAATGVQGFFWRLLMPLMLLPR